MAISLLIAAAFLFSPLVQAQDQSVHFLTEEGSEGVPVTFNQDGSMDLGPLSLSQDDEVYRIFDSVTLTHFDYVKTDSVQQTTSYSGDSAEMTYLDHSSPVIKLKTSTRNMMTFDVTSSAGALVNQQWAVVGADGMLADIFVNGEGTFAKSNDLVTADLFMDDSLFLRVRRPGEPTQVSELIASGQVAGELNVKRSGDTAVEEAVDYDGLNIETVYLNDGGARFKIEGEEESGIVAFSVPMEDAEAVKVASDGKLARRAETFEELADGGEETRYFLQRSDEGVFALVYLPSLSEAFIDIGSGHITPEDAFTVATLLSITAGLFLVATATVYLFRK